MVYASDGRRTARWTAHAGNDTCCLSALRRLSYPSMVFQSYIYCVYMCFNIVMTHPVVGDERIASEKVNGLLLRSRQMLDGRVIHA